VPVTSDQAVREEDEQSLSDPAKALAMSQAKQIRVKAEEWHRSATPPGP